MFAATSRSTIGATASPSACDIAVRPCIAATEASGKTAEVVDLVAALKASVAAAKAKREAAAAEAKKVKPAKAG